MPPKSRKKNVVDEQTAHAIADMLYEGIQDFLGDKLYFTRDTLLREVPIRAITRAGTMTGYKAVLIGTRVLLEDGRLIQKKRPDLCLPEKSQDYEHLNPAQDEYFDTILRIVRRIPNDEPFGVGDVVGMWRTDPQLTTDSKRKAVRLTLPKLIKGGFCAQGDDRFTFFTKAERRERRRRVA